MRAKEDSMIEFKRRTTMLGYQLTMSEPASPSPATAEAGSPRLGWFVALSLLMVAALGIVTVNVWLAGRLARQQRENSKQYAFWVLCQPGHTADDRVRAFLLLVAEGNKEWRSASLSDLNLEKVSLPDAQLEAAVFRRARLSGANLSGAKLAKSIFELADLATADLSKADLPEAQLYRTALNNAKLNRTILRGANLQEIKAEGAQFLAADLGDSDCTMANFTGASLAGCNLSGARLEAARFTGANLSLARLQDVNLRDADFSNCNWWRARGLRTTQIEFLKKNFGPTEKASPALRNDFEKWLKESK